jgi:uncharacterized protein (TIGR00251 family)
MARGAWRHAEIDMKIEVKVYPKSSRHMLVMKDGVLRAYVRSAPDKGKANRELVELLAEEYKVSKSKVIILKGETARNKIVEVIER